MSNTLLTIAGFDPTSGAGISMDLAVFRTLGFHGAALITAQTIQDTRGVSGLHITPPEFLERQHRALSDDIIVSGIKLGMLGGGSLLPVLDRILSRHPDIPVVADPVLRATSGAPLMEETFLDDLLKLLSRYATLLTPNLEEAEKIGGRAIRDRTELAAGAEAVYRRVGVPVLLKGGHLPGEAVDYIHDGETGVEISRPRIEGRVHGTGCFLSAAVLSGLARGVPLPEAGRRAGDLLARFLRKSRKIGSGQRLMVI